MPRKTYDYKAGRRRPMGSGGIGLEHLQNEMVRRRPAPTLPPDAAARFVHRPDCRGSSLTAFNGTRGDLMARCHTCNALKPVATSEENR